LMEHAWESLIMERHLSLKQAASVTAAVVTLALGAVLLKSESNSHANESKPQLSNPAIAAQQPGTTVELTASQLDAVKIGSVGTYEFPVDKETVGNISFADDLSVQVFPSYQGKIIKCLAELGDQVQKGQPLYTIESPDLIQAESNLIGAAATLDLTAKELARAKELDGNSGVSQREYEQAISDQQTAEGALKAARDAMRVFGKTDAEMDVMIAARKIDPALVVRSPISGEVTDFNAPQGLLVQPGNPPAPFTVSNVSIKWMLADVIESDIPVLHLGQSVQVNVMAYPDRLYRGKISKIYASVDPNTHRVTVRSEISDPKSELRPGMLANFVIRVHKPVQAPAIPANGVVREPDGTMVAWVTTDRHHFSQRVIKPGLRAEGQVEILDGLQPGELVVTDGAVFLSNMLEAPPSD
ncbi:MAG: efflux RND transporter periplasmic adaptor subunit, partial [Candidatus Acidiferrum sp.]